MEIWVDVHGAVGGFFIEMQWIFIKLSFDFDGDANGFPWSVGRNVP